MDAMYGILVVFGVVAVIVGVSIGLIRITSGPFTSNPSMVRYRIKKVDGLWYGEIYVLGEGGWCWVSARESRATGVTTNWPTEEECERVCRQEAESERALLRRESTPWSEPRA